MERIYLTKQEKFVLRYKKKNKQHNLSEAQLYAAVKGLEEKGFVRGAYNEGHQVETFRLLPYGENYIANNPHLYNPINWAKISALAAIISAIISVVALILSISK